MTHAIRAEGLVKEFKGKRALDRVDLTARRGAVLGVLGPNGSGKTTTVRILATLLRPDAGHAEVDGFDVLRHPHEVRRLIGLAGQYAAVDEELTGTQNLVLIARLLGFDRTQARGQRLDIAAGTAVRFEPGQTREVTLVPLRGARIVQGFRGDTMGPLDA